MIHVSVWLKPASGLPARRLCDGIIYNDGTGTSARGNYTYILRLQRQRVWRKGSLENFPRKRLNAWHLLYRVLAQALEQDNAKQV